MATHDTKTKNRNAAMGTSKKFDYIATCYRAGHDITMYDEEIALPLLVCLVFQIQIKANMTAYRSVKYLPKSILNIANII